MKKFGSVCFMVALCVSFLSAPKVILAEETTGEIFLPVINSGFEEKIPDHDFNSGDKIYQSRGENTIPGWEVYQDFTYKTWNPEETGKAYVNPIFYGVSQSVYKQTIRQAGVTAYEGANMLVLADQDENLTTVPNDPKGIYIHSEPISIRENVTYHLSYQVWSDWRLGDELKFYNADGQLWLNNTWVEANDENELAASSNFVTMDKVQPEPLKGGVWGEKILDRKAPSGAVAVRIAFYTPMAQAGNMCVDDVKLSFSPKTELSVRNGEFEEKTQIPGWQDYTYRTEENWYTPTGYFAFSSEQKTEGNTALKMQMTAVGPIVYKQSEPIIIPKEKTSDYIRLQMDVRSATDGRCVIGIHFFRNGEDGRTDTSDDMILRNAYYNAEYKTVAGGNWEPADTVSMTPGYDGMILNLRGQAGTAWKTFSFDAKRNEDYDYIKINIFQHHTLSYTQAWFDNISLSVGNDTDGFTPLDVRNAGFEESIEIPGWSSFASFEPNGNIFYSVTDDRALSGYLSLRMKDSDPSQTVGLWSDAFDVMENGTYELECFYQTDSMGFYDLKFFNSTGEVYNPSTEMYEAATEENLCRHSAVLESSGGKNVTVQKRYTVPKGAMKARICLMSSLEEESDCYFDAVRLSFFPNGELMAQRPVLLRGEEVVTHTGTLKENDVVRGRTLLYNNTDEERNVRLVMARYDHKGIMRQISIKNVTLPARDSFSKQNTPVEALTEPMTLRQGEGSFRIFVIDAFDRLKNIIPSVYIGNAV